MSRHKSLNHARYRLTVHLIFSTKYRTRALVGIEDEVKNVMSAIADESDFDLIEIGIDKDHLHMVVSIIPRLSVTQVVRRLKSRSTIMLWKDREDHLGRFYRGRKHGVLWTHGYFCESVGRVSEQVILDYVRNQ